jgi:hypothetical protein
MSKRSWSAVDIAVIGLAFALVMFFVAVAVVLAVNGNAPTAFWSAGGAVSGGLLGLLAEPPRSGASQRQVAARVAGDLTHTAALQAATAVAGTVPGDQKQAASDALNEVSERGVGLLARIDLSVPKSATPVAVADESAALAVNAHRDAARGADDALRKAKTMLSHAEAEVPPDADKIQQAASAVAAATGKSAVLGAAADAANKAKPGAADRGVTVAATASPSGSPTAAVWTLLLIFLGLLGAGVLLAAGAVTPPESFGTGPLDNLTKTIVALASAAGTGLIGLLAPAPSTKGSGVAAVKK